jgi:hypothetical protein
MTQDQIDKRISRADDLQMRRAIIAMLRIVESRLGVESSLRPGIGKQKENVTT